MPSTRAQAVSNGSRTHFEHIKELGHHIVHGERLGSGHSRKGLKRACWSCLLDGKQKEELICVVILGERPQRAVFSLNPQLLFSSVRCSLLLLFSDSAHSQGCKRVPSPLALCAMKEGDVVLGDQIGKGAYGSVYGG